MEVISALHYIAWPTFWLFLIKCISNGYKIMFVNISAFFWTVFLNHHYHNKKEDE